LKKILYIDLDNVLVDFQSGIDRVPKDVRREFKGRLDDIPGIFALMDPMPGAVKAYRELAQRFDTYVLSTSPWENPSAWSDKLNWVKRHLKDDAYKRLILTHHKELNRGAYLVDDRKARGAAEFEGKLILFGSKKFPDWPSVTRYLRPRSGR
jgi:5'-nucleotidase